MLLLWSQLSLTVPEWGLPLNALWDWRTYQGQGYSKPSFLLGPGPPCWNQGQLLTEDTSHETLGWVSPASTAPETPTLKQQHTNSRGMASWYSHNHPSTRIRCFGFGFKGHRRL